MTVPRHRAHVIPQHQGNLSLHKLEDAVLYMEGSPHARCDLAGSIAPQVLSFLFHEMRPLLTLGILVVKKEDQIPTLCTLSIYFLTEPEPC